MKRAIGFALIAIVGALAGCPAAHDPFPDKSCTNNTDCYQGEVCFNMMCQPPPDLAVPVTTPPDLAVAPTVDLAGDDL